LHGYFGKTGVRGKRLNGGNRDSVPSGNLLPVKHTETKGRMKRTNRSNIRNA